MSEVLIAISRKDGGVSIKSIPTLTGAVDASVVDAEIQKWMTTLGSDLNAWTPIAGWRPIARSEIPSDREFRNALTDHPTDGLVHDVEKAKGIAIDRVRELRNVELAQWDVLWQSAMGQKDQATADAIDAKRQILRDMPNDLTVALDKAASISDIKGALAASVAMIDATKPGMMVRSD